MDTLSRERRSWNMSRIRGKNTGPERAVRSALHRMGYRFRLHCSGLPGKPDIVLRKYNTVIFVHGCFWHRHAACRLAYTPKSRRRFWKQKFERNIQRDREVARTLAALGWRVRVIWECETESDTLLSRRLRSALGSK
ncbi:MAG: very short patch repair endonuclease [Armatimonadetes bacterium]|nr:very short patch repair endonuclease [Armatimonadota bacterium]